MTARLSPRVLLLASAVLLSACVTTPEDTYSSADIEALRERGWQPDVGSLSAGQLEARVQAEVATPITFHGLLLDAAGEPIVDHAVGATIFDRPLHPFESPFYGWVSLNDLRTDRHGRFSITDRQGAALVISVTDENYWDIDEGRAQRVYYYAPARLGENAHPLPTDPDEPAVLRLGRKPAEARTELVRLGAIRLTPGKTVGVALDRPRYPVEAEAADLLLRLDRDDTTGGRAYHWSLTVQVPGGGIQRARTLFLDQAPEGGYASELTFGHDAGDDAWRHRGEMLCFIRTAGGNYASLKFRVRTLEQPFVSISGKRNPHGERYLD